MAESATTQHRPALWTSSFIGVFLTNLFTAHAFYILLACMPLFVVNELKLNESYAGVVMGVFSITGVAMRLLSGVLLDRMNRLPLLIAGLAIFTLCTFGYITAGSFLAILLIRLAHGAGWGLVSTAGSTIAADVVPPSRRAEGLGYYSMTMSIGMALGPALGTLFLGTFSFSQIFICCSALSVCALVSGFFIKLPPSHHKKHAFTWTSFVEKRVFGISFMFLFFGIAYGGVLSFVILLGQRLHIAHSGFYFMIFAIVLTITRPSTGRYFDKHGPGNMMGLGFVFAICAVLLLAFASGPLVYFLSAVCMGIGSGTIMAFLVAMAMNIIPPQRRGATNATIFTAFDAGIGIGAVALGWLASRYSIQVMYTCSAVLLSIPLAYYYMRGRRDYHHLLES